MHIMAEDELYVIFSALTVAKFTILMKISTTVSANRKSCKSNSTRLLRWYGSLH